jgi:outer membrane autotransporter protein
VSRAEAHNPFEFYGGTLSGTGIVSGSVILGGLCGPGPRPGALQIDGDLTETAFGELTIELGPKGGISDQLSVSGHVSLAGALTVTNVSGFTPSPGDQFRVLTFTSRTGDFSTFDNDTGSVIYRAYDPAGLTLVVSNSARLNISRAGQDLLISWTPNLARFALQSSTNLVSSNWVTLPATGTNTIVVSPTQNSCFFRIIRPLPAAARKL